MKSKLIFLPMVLFIALCVASCGGDKVSSITADAPKEAVSSKVTVQSVLASVEKGKYTRGELLVKFKAGVMTTQSLRTHQALGASVVRRFSSFPNLERVKLPAGLSVKDAVVRYMSDPNVEYAEPNYIRHITAVPNDNFFGQQWALRNTGLFAGGTAGADIKAPEAWDVLTGDETVVIAVLDTGIDLNHPDLVNNIWTNPGEIPENLTDDDNNGKVDDWRGWDFTTCAMFDDNLNCIAPKPEGNDPSDDRGHGTHVSGIIGARGNNGIGTAGVMWSVKIMPLKIFNADGFGSVGDELHAIDYAVNIKTRASNAANIKAINASFGSSDFSLSERDMITSAGVAGILFVAAAGNFQNDNDVFPEFPASYSAPIFGGLPNIISVAATDQNDTRASFSGYGLNSVQVAAPGVYILSTVPPTGVAGSFSSSCTGSFSVGYDFCSGTSMAAPHVTGLVGLLSSYYGGFTSSQIRATILRSVDVLPSLSGWIQTGGRINVYRALSSLETPAFLTATAKSSSEISLAWDGMATGEAGYKIERKTGAGSFVQLGTVDRISRPDVVPQPPVSYTFADSGLDASTTYTYRVRAYNDIPADSGFSVWASATTLDTDTPPPPPPSSGGGCSIGVRQNTPTAVGDLGVLLMPLALVAILRRRR